MSDKRAIIIFELLPLQVFCYQTVEEWSKGMAPEQVFWREKGTDGMYGPFVSIYAAVNNYTGFKNKTKILGETPTPNNIVMIDFKSRRKMP
jgi:hypothetical protein